MKYIIILSSLFLTMACIASELPPMHVKSQKAIDENLKKHDSKKYARRIYLKLPLLQPRFHWEFTEKNKFLEGNLTLIIESQNNSIELPIFKNSAISKDWKVMSCSSRDNSKNNLYFGFISKIPYEVAETDEVHLTLNVKNDIRGIGAEMTGLLKKGAYNTSSQFKLYHLEKSTGKKDVYAYLNNDNWNVLWELKIIDNKGWMEDRYNKKQRIQLTSAKEDNNLELSFDEAEKTTLSVVNHKTKRFFFEYFLKYSDLANYITNNIDNMPVTIKCNQYTPEITLEFLKKCQDIQESINPIKLIYETKKNMLKPINKNDNIHFYRKYKYRGK